MSDYITRADILREAGPLHEQASTIRRTASQSAQGAVFLSHSTLDEELLDGVIRILERHGADVYTDKTDLSLPPVTSRETAATLKARIKLSRKFIVLTSEKSKSSRWVPWELGLADGFLNPKNVAVFPTVETTDEYDWVEREYFGLYDRVTFGLIAGKGPIYKVRNHEKKVATSLTKWLARD